MSCIVSIDPDTKNPGVAIFVNGLLHEAWAVSPAEARLRLLSARSIVNAFAHPGDVAFVCEMPQQYGREGDQRDFLAVARVVGFFEGIAHQKGASFRAVTPREWKGTAPKKITIQRAWSALLPAERRICDLTLQAKRRLERGAGLVSGKGADVMDAIGIGLWALKRDKKAA